MADFYCRTGKPALAENQLSRIIDGKVRSSDSDVVWARRQLAMILVNRGGYQNFQKARDLIDKNLASPAVSVLDCRAKATIDALSPEATRRKNGLQMLETMVQDQSATPEERFALAQMYLAAGNWTQASIQFRNLVAFHNTEPRYLIAYVAALMDHGETANAESYLGRLEEISPNHIDTIDLRGCWWRRTSRKRHLSC